MEIQWNFEELNAMNYYNMGTINVLVNMLTEQVQADGNRLKKLLKYWNLHN